MAVEGRKVVLKKGSGVSATVVAGGRTTTIKINNEPLDITDNQSGGWRELHAGFGVKSIDIDLSAIFKNDELIDIAISTTGSTLLQAYEVDIDGLGVFAGSFFLNAAEISAPHDNSTEITGTLLSSGAITWTADS